MVYKGLGCIEKGRVPHIDNVHVEAISKTNWLMCTEVVYKGLGFIEEGRVPHIDYVYVEAISKSNV